MGLMVAFPPWKAGFRYESLHREKPIGYAFIASPPKAEGYWNVSVDITRLVLQAVGVICVAGALLIVSWFVDERLLIKSRLFLTSPLGRRNSQRGE